MRIDLTLRWWPVAACVVAAGGGCAPEELSVRARQLTTAAAGQADEPRLVALSLEISTVLRGEPSADALQAAALVDMANVAADRASAERPVALLRKAMQLAPKRASLHADLASALLTVARAMDDPLASIDALEVAAAAARIFPRDRQVRTAFESALKANGLEARASTVNGIPSAVRPPVTRSAPEDSSSQQLREAGWYRLMPAWARAELVGDSMGARTQLRLVERTAAQLAARGADASLQASLNDLARAPSQSTRQRLARAYLAVATGRRAYEAFALDTAISRFREALTLAPHGSVVRVRARSLYARSLVLAGETPQAVPQLDSLASELAPVPMAELAAEYQWTLGTIALRRGDLAQARRRYARADSTYRALGERGNAAAMLALQCDVTAREGRTRELWRCARRASSLLVDPGGATWRHVVSMVVAWDLLTRGRPHAAVEHLRDDLERSSPEAGGADRHESRGLLVQALLLVDSAEARAVLDTMIHSESEFSDETTRRSIRATRQRLQGHLLATRQPVRARALLDSALAYDRKAGYAAWVLDALLSRSEADLQLRDLPSAEASLDTAMSMIEEERASLEGLPGYGLLYRRARGVVERLILLQVGRDGGEWRALETLHRARQTSVPPRSVHKSQREDTARLTYALVDSRLFSWLEWRGGRKFMSQMVDSSALNRRVTDLLAAIERDAEEAEVRPELEQFHALLLQPLFEQKRLPRTILLDLTGTLADVPFGALYDRQRGRYLVEDAAISIAGPPSARPVRRSRQQGLLVVSPALADLPALPGAEREAAVVRQNRGAVSVLRGPDASRDAVLRALPQSRWLHFSGHAVLDTDRPELGALLLVGAGDSAATISAADIARLDLRGLELAVLSACETARGPAAIEGLRGMADAFLVAGTAVLVGSGWRVGDSAAPQFMEHMYRELESGKPAAESVQRAQLAMLRSSSPGGRRMRDWAAWRVIKNTNGS